LKIAESKNGCEWDSNKFFQIAQTQTAKMAANEIRTQQKWLRIQIRFHDIKAF